MRRILRRLLRVVRPDDADVILDDIQEVFRERRMERPNRLGGVVWFGWQLLAAVLHGLADRASDWTRAFQGVDGPMMRGFRSNLALDLRHAVRRIVRTPGFTAVVVLTMAVGIGTSTAVFSVVRTVLLEPLPYPEADRLVRLVETVPPTENPRGVAEERTVMDAQRVVRWRALTKTLSAIGTYLTTAATVVTAAGTSRAVVAQVSPEIFPMLGVRMHLGRPFRGDDERSDSRIVVLSAAAHHVFFGGSNDVIGRTLALDGVGHTVVGVAGEGFDFPSQQTELWIPLVLDPSPTARQPFVNVLARLHADVSEAEASTEANEIGIGLANEANGVTASTPPEPRYRVVTLQNQMTAAIAPTLRVFMAAAFVVMLVVTANILTLLLSRGTRQRQDALIQRALGASRVRVVRQVLIEAMLLGALGAAGGLVLSYGSLELLKAMARVNVPELFQLAARQQFGSGSVFPRLDAVGIDVAALAFAMLTAVVASAIAGLGPALQIASDERRSFRDSTLSHPGAVSEKGARIRSALVVGQVAAGTALLVAAVLLIRSFSQMSQLPMGYDPANVLSFQLVVPAEYPISRKEHLAHELAGRLQALPGVDAAGFSNLPPLAGGAFAYGLFLPPGRTIEEMQRDPDAPQARSVSRGYLPAMGVRLLEGRWFGPEDDAASVQVMIVTRAVAHRYFSAQSPIGAQVQLLPGPHPWTIIGVVDDIHNGTPWEESYPQFFMDSRQVMQALPGLPERMRETAAIGFLSYAVRADHNQTSLVAEVRSAVRQLDPDAALDGLMPLDEIASASLSRPRFYAVWSGLFALVAAVLGCMGMYATVAYATLRRTREIGIRVALGAQRSAVVGLVMSQGIALAAAGVVVGLGAALVLSRYLTALLFGVTKADVLTYVVVGSLFLLAAAAASLIPALRATRISPVRALRYE